MQNRISTAPPKRGGRSLVGWLLLAALVAAVAWIAASGALAPAELKAAIASAKAAAGARPALAILAFAGLYVVFAAASLPGAWVLSVGAGAIFGPWAAAPMVALSATIGGTLAMLAARFFFRDWVAARFPDAVARVDRGVAKEGAPFLFAARLTPAIPFFLINLAIGLTRMPAHVFALVSLVGMAPLSVVYVTAGAELTRIETPSDILGPRVLLALLALAAAPFLAQGFGVWRARRAALARWSRPKRFDYNLIVVGAGSAGLVAANVAAAVKAKVALIEEGAMGGDCLNTGCVPSKALLRSAKLAHEGANAAAYGLKGRLEPDFPAAMARVRKVIAAVAPHDSAERYRGLGVEVIAGRARLVDPWSVEVDSRRLTARRIVVATGAAPILPPIPGLADVEPLTSETLWRLEAAPRRLLVVGGGAIGCELAQAFARLGSSVTIVEAAPRIMAREDEEVSAAMRAALAADGVAIFEGVGVAAFAANAGVRSARLADGRAIEFDRALIAIGRRPRLAGFGLEELGLIENGRLVVDEKLRTRLPTIYAAGDVVGALQFTHAAGQYGVAAALNALLSPLALGRKTLPAFPTVVYTDPEIARVGLSESEARERGVAYEATHYDLGELDRAIADGAADGSIKALTVPGRDRLIGVTIVGARAGDMLAPFTLAMRHRLGMKAILSTIAPYPGWSEAARATAAQWRRAHTSAWTLRLAEQLFARARG